ncbi:MAG: helix-turn-helix domain-containing protein [Gemmatimonadetes bacterium]|nr:helix-turn-helix transcriptional regulator [Gemmatimonadota bacterium]NIR80194.1 helix-turn-helix transcriptional regulator [Gemmatimonadota bacterium]NIT88956.1 helix-turn-helix transcriptional regulator [Gemmatimonadota bacterium]NIU32751.1 helix-turn-helix transcriptional regulator [Gemmatimonadota bacterium]NIU37183.1 helix-turn-helix domain-containing protein [Gemmatimonadota bacterium]
MKPEAVRWARDKLGLTQKEMADALDVHWRSIQNWERDGAPLTVGYAIPGLFMANWMGELAQEFLMSQGDLFDLDEDEEERGRAG